MFAFLDSPIQLLVVGMVVLVVFGPQKLPEIAGQLGRAIRELKRAGQEFQDTIRLEESKPDTTYDPPHYDSYDNPYDSTYSTSDESGGNSWEAQTTTAAEPPHGDFAASALADTGDDYGVSQTPAAPAVSVPVRNGTASNGASASESNAPVYGVLSEEPSTPGFGVLSPPEQAVPRGKTAS